MKYFSTSSILFADFVGFTKLVEKLEAGDLIETLTVFFKGFDKLAQKHNVTKVKTIGDCYMCVSGIPETRKGTCFANVCLRLGYVKICRGYKYSTRSLGEACMEITHRNSFGSFDSQLSNRRIRCMGRFREHCSENGEFGASRKSTHLRKKRQILGSEFSLSLRGEVELKTKVISKRSF